VRCPHPRAGRLTPECEAVVFDVGDDGIASTNIGSAPLSDTNPTRRKRLLCMSTVQVSSPRPGVALITLDRHDRLNAMSHQLVADLHGAFDRVAVDGDTRVVVLTGAGRGFCAGLDLKCAGRPPGAYGLGRIARRS
jgi:Enoyl-CoA hydratase/isomerase